MDISLKELRNIQKLQPVYFIPGQDLFIKERAIFYIKNIVKSLNGSAERVNFDNLDLNDWIASLYDIPMFSSARLVIAGDISDLKDKELSKILDYVEKPSTDIVLVLTSAKIDKRKKKLLEIMKKSTVCLAESPKDKDLSSWIKGFAKERGKDIETLAVETIKIMFGNNLAAIEKEIEKISLYISDREIIKREDVEFISTGDINSNIFNIFNFIANRNKKDFLKLLYELLNKGQHQLAILSLVTGRIRKLILGKDLLKNKASDSEMAGFIGIPPYFLRDFKDELSMYNEFDLKKMYKKCMIIDSELKSLKHSNLDVFISGMISLVDRG